MSQGFGQADTYLVQELARLGIGPPGQPAEREPPRAAGDQPHQPGPGDHPVQDHARGDRAQQSVPRFPFGGRHPAQPLADRLVEHPGQHENEQDRQLLYRIGNHCDLRHETLASAGTVAAIRSG